MRRLVLLNPESVQGDREKYCRLMAYNDTHMMLAVTQPSFTDSGFNSTSLLMYRSNLTFPPVLILITLYS